MKTVKAGPDCLEGAHLLSRHERSGDPGHRSSDAKGREGAARILPVAGRTTAHVKKHSTRMPGAILGVPFDPVTLSEAAGWVEAMIESGRPHHVATANVDFVVQAQSDVELRRILAGADLVLCDGAPLVWASWILRHPFPERVAGADLVPELIRLAARKGYRIFLLGATPEAAARAVEKLTAEHPELQIAGHYSPPFKPLLQMDHEEIRRRIQESRPDILLVAFGCPKQEKWIAMNHRRLGVPVAIGVGATIDFLGGAMKRAPVWMQRSGTEWLFRLAQEPRRLFKRYAWDLAVFGTRFLAQLWFSAFPGCDSRWASCWERPGVRDWRRVAFPERFDWRTVARSSRLFEQLISDGRHCVLEMHSVKFIDGSGVGVLLMLWRHFRRQGRGLVLVAPGSEVLRVLRFMRVVELFRTAERLDAALLAHELANVRERREEPGRNPLVWEGEVTCENAETFWDTTRHRCEHGLADVQIDISRVTYVDSSGAEVMARLKRTAELSGRRVFFTGANGAVRNVLRFCGLEELALAGGFPSISTDRSTHSRLILSQQT